MQAIPNERHLSSPNERVHYSSDSWEQRAAGRGMDDKTKRQNRSEGDAWYPPMAMDCKTLPLPPPLAVFFLIASWVILGSFKMGAMGWRHWRGIGGVILCVCLCECVLGKGKEKERHLVLLRQWISTLIGSRIGITWVSVCLCVCMRAGALSVAAGDKRSNAKHTCTHNQTQMWNH